MYFAWDLIGKQLGSDWDRFFVYFCLGCDWEAIGIDFSCIFVWDLIGKQLGSNWEAIGKRLGSIFRVFSPGI